MTKIMSLLERLGQKFSLGKRIHEHFFKRLVTRLVLLAFLNQNLAFATNSIIELDFKDSQAPQRLHTILPFSKIVDVSHIEIDTQKRQVAVYRKEEGNNIPQEDKDPSSGLPDAIQRQSVIVPAHDIHNLPWELESEKLTLFLLQHTAWLTPLGEDGYTLEFRGGLLGGMKAWGNSYRGVQSDGQGGWQLNVPVVKHFQMGSGGFGNSISNGELMQLSNRQSQFFQEQRKKEEEWRQQTFGTNPTTSSGGYRPSQNASQPFVFTPKNTSEDLENLRKQQKLEEEQYKKQKEIKEKKRQERDKKNLTPYLESWNTLYPNRAKKNAQELVADPTTGYRSGMTPKEAQKIYDTWYKGRYEQTVTSETILPYLKAYYPSLQDVRYDPHISQVEHQDTSQIRPQSFFENDIRQAKDKRVLDPYLESWNKLYPERAKKQYYELASDPDTGYRSGMTPAEAQKIYDTWYKGRYESLSSSEGAALFKGAPSQDQVTPAYFAQSALQAGMTASRAVEILTNPTLENAYERVLLASRQNTLGGRDNPFVFRDMGLSVGEAYDNLLIHLRGEYFGQLLDERTNQGIKKGFERFCREKQAIFEDYLVEEWGVKDWRQVAEWLDYDAQLMQVGKKLPFDIDPMAPHDMFNLQDKMGGFGGGKLGLERLRHFKNTPPVLQRQPDFKWTVKEPNVADKIGRHPTFGNIYKDSTQKVGNKEVWWSKDTAKHGGSNYKLFEEKADHFKWIGDVDATGKVVLKHKSEIGMRIEKSEINWIK